MSPDQPTTAEPDIDQDRRALLALADACDRRGMRARLLEREARPVELRVWDPDRAAAAVSIGCRPLDDSSEAGAARMNRWFTIGGERLAPAAALGSHPESVVRTVRERLRALG